MTLCEWRLPGLVGHHNPARVLTEDYSQDNFVDGPLLEAMREGGFPDDEDIVVRERVRTRRSVILLVDVSGSMRGERVRTAAACAPSILTRTSLPP
ncbi:MAG TPA: hypothetical protein VGG75_35270 [Trebonia sp.]|jgi:uncharacterized protein with von Willebrand factor type A (vWA) domain